MKKVRGSYKNSKVIGAYAKSNWVRYRDGRWIPTRKRVFLYWHKFLVEAEKSDEYQVDWSKYEGWGGSNYILGNKFDTFWEENWKELFSTESRDDEPRYNISTKAPKADAYKLRLKIWSYRHLDSILEISIKVGLDVKNDEAHRDLFTKGFHHSDFMRTTQDPNIRRVTLRHMQKAKEHLKNVSKGSFP